MAGESLATFLRLVPRADAATKVRLGLFSLSRLLYRATRVHLYRGGDFTFRFGRFRVRQGRGDLGTIAEIFGRRVYHAAGFEPADGDVCVDVGANIGCVTILWRGTNPSGPILAIEPHPLAAQILRTNIGLNPGAGRTIVIEAAAGRHEAPAELAIDAAGQTIARSPHAIDARWIEGYPQERRVRVAGITLDALLREQALARIDLLKIDVEGFEDDCLAGAADALRLTRRVILEYHSDTLRARCLERLTEAGFAIEERAPILFARRDAAA